MARVHSFRLAQGGLLGQEAEVDDVGEHPTDTFSAAATSDRKGQLKSLLNQMLSSKPALDVAHEVLKDKRLKTLAWMFLSCNMEGS